MKHALRFIFLIVVLSCSGLNSFAQKANYDDVFARIDSMASNQQARPALKLIEELNVKARKDGNTAIIIKSVMYRRLFQSYLDGNDLIRQINLLRQDVLMAKQPEKSILQSLLAETIWNYYNQNSYKISQRSSVIGDIDDDVATWPIRKLLAEVTRLYLASISDVSLLQNTPISSLEDVLTGDKNTRYLQPTLYDLLANSALVVFKNTQLRLPSADTQAVDLVKMSRIIFKTILEYHQKHGNTAAYCDGELTRLRFFRTYNNSTEEDTSYFDSLKKLLKQSEGTEIYSNVLYEMALLYKEGKVKLDKGENSLKIAVELAERAVSAFPKSSGSSYAQSLLQQIRALALDITIGGFNMPDQTIKVLYQSKNIDTLYLSVYRLSLDEAQHFDLKQPVNYYRFLNRRAIKNWTRIQGLVNDYKTHELKDSIGGLPIGDYVLIAQNRPILDTLNERLINRFVQFKVTGLVVSTRDISENVNEFKLYDARNGLPVKGVKVEEEHGSNRTFTNGEGFSSLRKTLKNFNTAIVSLGKDSLAVKFSQSYGYDSDEEEEIKVIFFTDRPIYRPGQEVFYKGLVLKEKLGASSVVAGQKVTVSFSDVNRNEIRKLDQTSNEYGSFSGSFIIPTGKLNGDMEISTEFGEIEVRVEEYKRPTFEVSFPWSEAEYRYNDTVRVKGSAKSYAGYPIGNAQVKYTVSVSGLQILSGTTNTNDEGFFQVAFFPPQKDKLARRYDYYAVKAEVTDLAGETRMATKELSLHGGGLNISLSDYEDQIFIKSEKELSLRVSTRSYNKVKAKVRIEWFYLKPPRGLGRRSLGDDSDTTLSTKNWKATKVPLEQNLVTNDGNIKFNLKEGDLKPGYYRQRVTAISEKLDTGVNDKIYRIYDSKPDSIVLRSEWAILEKRMLNVGEEALIRIAGFNDSSNVFYEVTASKKIVKSGWIKVSPLQTFFKLPILKTFGHGVDVDFMMVQDGEWHSSRERVYISDPSRELNVKFLSFRNHLQPGEKETWRLRITNQLGKQRQVELLATLYDASLEALKNFDYDSWQYRGVSRISYPSWQTDHNSSGTQGSVYLLNRDFKTSVFSREYERLNGYSYNYNGSPNYSFNNYLQDSDVEYQKRRLAKANERLKKIEDRQKIYGLIKDPNGYGIQDVAIMRNYTKVKPSDAYGVYALDAKVGDRITFTSSGFITSSIIVKSLGRYDVTLKEVAQTLNGVTIRGYVKRTREATTGASFVVSGREVRDNPVGNVEQLLQGKVAGLNIMNNRSAFQSNLDPGAPGSLGKINPRTNFSETAFFYPQLRTNAAGEINIEFTIPQSLTRYRMLGFAHTKAFETLFFSKELVTQKQFAIAANAPRFFREGDTIVFSAKLNSMAGKVLKGKAYLEFRDALTGKVTNIFSAGTSATKNFEVADNGNAVLNWPLLIPAGIEAVTYKVVAESGKYSDGEESTIPVLSNSILVTEAISLNVRGNTTKTFTMEKLLQSGKSSTMRNQSLTLEFTSNPIWNAIQALPYLMEYPYECSEQTMSRFYANSFATSILNSSPKIKAVFEEWQKAGSNAFSSNLEKNAELKALLLEETPWVRNAGSEEDRKKRLATLFDLNRMSSELSSNFEKLADLQNANGSFPWFKGMSENRYITQQIVLNLGQLKYLKMIDDKSLPAFNSLLNKAIIYLDGQFISDFNSNSSFKGFYSTPLHYLYARSYNKQINEDKSFTAALNKGLEQINLNWLKMSTYEQGLAALVLHRNGRQAQAMKIVNSFKDRSQQSDEMGMYWPDNSVGWWWYQSPVETQALMIEVFDEVANDVSAVEELKIWLLKNKQNNEWRTTKATTAACYALLMRGYNLLNESNEPEIHIGVKTIAQLGLSEPIKEAGTGYRKIKVDGASVKPEMGTIVIKNNNKGIAWGGVYWQYFERADKVTNAGTGITIKKELFLQSSTVAGPVLNRLSQSNSLQKGDLIKVRIEIRCDRPMEYMHLKDMRAAGFEPVNVLSGYRYQDGLGYYESTKDASTNFFIDYMPKGVYVFEYPLRVNSSGNFSNGVTTLQSMYAPEFTTHSEGIRVSVK